MENLEIFLSMTGTAFSLFIAAVTFAVKFFKKLKEKIKTENGVKLSNALIPLIENAEQFLNYDGKEKKEYVLTKANQFAIENKISFDSKFVSDKIEELVVLTKRINVRDKDKYKQSETN